MSSLSETLLVSAETQFAANTAATESTTSLWRAELSLGIDAFPHRGSRLTHCRHRGPLRVQKPFYPEGPECAHIYLLHPPGGLVSGDSLAIDIRLSARAQALVTTPGAGKVYAARKNGTQQRQDVSLQLGQGAAIEWFPQETIVFDGAEARLSNRIDLAPDAVFIGWDILCLGRPASQMPFHRGSVEQRYEFWRDNKMMFRERLVLSAADSVRNSLCGFNRQPVSGTFFATLGQRQNSRELVEELRYRSPHCEGELAITQIRELCVVRYLGAATEEAKKVFQHFWQILRPALLRRQACAPRIWRT